MVDVRKKEKEISDNLKNLVLKDNGTKIIESKIAFIYARAHSGERR